MSVVQQGSMTLYFLDDGRVHKTWLGGGWFLDADSSYAALLRKQWLL